MRPPIKAYAASTPRAPLEPFSFDPGEIGPEEVELRLLTAGYATRTFPCSITNGACPSIPSFPVTKQWARSSTSALKPKVSKSASASASDGQPTVVSPVGRPSSLRAHPGHHCRTLRRFL